MSKALTLIVDIHAKSEHRQLVRETLAALARETVKEAGNLCYRLHEVDDDPDQFVIYEQWKDKAALDFHMKQEYLVAFLAQEERLLSKRIAGKFCREMS